MRQAHGFVPIAPASPEEMAYLILAFAVREGCSLVDSGELARKGHSRFSIISRINSLT